jgi:TPR repeat protein
MSQRAPAAFFSYSREDSAFALRLAADLKAGGANVWLDQIDIEPGLEWDSAIEEAVAKAPQMLLILSRTSVKSRNVRNEISYALEEKKTIIPVLYEDCVVPLQLHRIQHIDFRNDYESGLKVLLKALGVERPAAKSEGATRAGAATGQAVEPGTAERERQMRESQEAEERHRQEELRRQAEKEAQAEVEGKRAAEQARLREEERKQQEAEERKRQAAEQTRRQRLEEEARGAAGEAQQVESPKLRAWQTTNRTERKFPGWAKGAISVPVILLVSWGFYTALSGSGSTEQPKENSAGSKTAIGLSPKEAVAAAKALYAKGDYSSAVPLLELAVKGGNAEGKYLLSNHYDISSPRYTGVDKDQKKSLELCRAAAEAGNSDSMLSMGWSYARGFGVEKDYGQAISWFRKAIEAGNANGMTSLGDMYAGGRGLNKDYREALAWYQKGLEGGDPWAMAAMGSSYFAGQGVPKNYSEAVNWYRKAAESESGTRPMAVDAKFGAMVYLGYMYAQGQGVQRSYGQALSLFQKAADGGIPSGMVGMGDVYLFGYGQAKDYAVAASWYRKAAECNDPSGMRSLGYVYEKGLGVEKDHQQAISWYRKAAQQDDQPAIDFLKQLGQSP